MSITLQRQKLEAALDALRCAESNLVEAAGGADALTSHVAATEYHRDSLRETFFEAWFGIIVAQNRTKRVLAHFAGGDAVRNMP